MSHTRRGFLTLLAATASNLPAFAAKLAKRTAAKSKPRITLCSDSTELYYAAPGNMKREDLERIYTEQLLGTQVDIFTWDAAMPDLCFYGTKVGEYWGQNWNEPFPSLMFWYIHSNIKTMIEAGTDPLAVVADTVHKLGITFLAGIRMNDIHHPGHRFMQTRFWLDHPEWRIKGGGQMDYAIPAVREHRFAIIREIVEGFNIDGLSLDFQRNCPHLSEPAAKKAEIITDFVRQIRELLDQVGRRRGKTMILLARVPTTIEACTGNGLDILTWAKQDIIQYLCPSHEHNISFNMDVEQFARALQGADCGLYPALFLETNKDYRGYTTPAMNRACAFNFYSQGADGISTYNWSRTGLGSLPFDKRTLKEVGSMEQIQALERHYFFFDQAGGDAIHTPPKLQITFTDQDAPDVRKAVSFRFYEPIAEGKLSCRMNFKICNLHPEDRVELELNGKVVALEKFKIVWHAASTSQLAGGESLPPYAAFELQLTSPPIQRGLNELGMRLKRGGPEIIRDVELKQLQIVVRRQ